MEKSHFAYTSPVVYVRKKCGGLRLCIDYWKLNNKAILDKQPIPKIQDILDSLGGQEWFSVVDMSKAYPSGLHYISQIFTILLRITQNILTFHWSKLITLILRFLKKSSVWKKYLLTLQGGMVEYYLRLNLSSWRY